MSDHRIAEVGTLDEQLALTRHALVDKIWRWGGYFALVNLPIIVWRARVVGWQPQLLIHIALSAMTVTIALFSARMRYAAKAGLLVFGAAAVGVAGVLSLGMVGAGYFWIALAAGLVSVLYSPRAGVQFAMLSSVLLIAAGFGFVTGRLTIPIDLNAHAVSASGWIAFLLVTTIVPFVMIHAIGGFQKTVMELLARLHSQRDQLLVQRDLLDRQRAQLEILASHDSLTGLPLARLAADRLRATLDRSVQSGTRTALLFIDLDGFKAVNDTHGHEVGDLVLTEVARRLTATLRGNDTVARIGGDEFILLLADARDIEAAAAAVATKLITEIAQPIGAAGTTVSVGASIGIAVCPGHAADMTDLRRRADAAMYRAKRAGKNRYCFAEPGEPLPPEADSTPQR